MVEGAHAEQRGHIGDFEHFALFRLRATGADARLGALERNAGRILKKIMQRAAGEMLEHVPEGEVRKVMVYLAYRHAVNATQGTQVNDIVALLNAQRVRHVAGGRTQYREQLFAGRVAALIQQVLAKARLGV